MDLSVQLACTNATSTHVCVYGHSSVGSSMPSPVQPCSEQQLFRDSPRMLERIRRLHRPTTSRLDTETLVHTGWSTC